MAERLHFHFSLSCIGEGNGNPLQCSCLENPRDGGAWWADVCGVTQSQTRLMWLSSNSGVSGVSLDYCSKIKCWTCDLKKWYPVTSKLTFIPVLWVFLTAKQHPVRIQRGHFHLTFLLWGSCSLQFRAPRSCEELSPHLGQHGGSAC